MRHEFLHREGSRRLILLFAGWSTGPEFYSHITLPGWDTLLVYGYEDLDFPQNILDGYDIISLFAWSMGVFAASRVIPAERVSMAIAVNGTEFPADDRRGIPTPIFKGTADSLNERNLIKFQRRMAGATYNDICSRLPQPEITTLKKELEFILELCSREGVQNHSRIFWNRVYISSDDRIFPAANQHQAWSGNPSQPQIVKLDGAHYTDLFPIVKSALPSTDKIGARFSKALPTYDNEASAQKEIAERLASMCPPGKRERIVEIGPGSGIFTSLITGRMNPVIMDLVDLYPLPDFGLDSEIHAHVVDAEEWMEREAYEHPHSRDAIVSASSIQWFVNPRRFFHNAARLLKPDGILACSTFLPDNLHELRAVNPYGIVYRSRLEIEGMLLDCFASFSIHEDAITLQFGSPRHMLAHLRDTGVGGNAATGLSLREISSRLPSTLTYRPLFIIARKPITAGENAT